MSETTTPPAWAVERARGIVDGLLNRPIPLGATAAYRDCVLIELQNRLAAALTVPDGHVRLPSGEVVPIICVSYAGRAACPGKPYDGEPMQDIRIAYPVAESARAGGGA